MLKVHTIFLIKEQGSAKYFVFSLVGRRLFKTASKHHNGKSFSSSVPVNSVIFFLHGPPWEPSVMMDGGETEEKSNGGYTGSFAALLSSVLDAIRFFLVSFAGKVSPEARTWGFGLCFFFASQWPSRPFNVSRPRLIYKSHNPMTKIGWNKQKSKYSIMVNRFKKNLHIKIY